jgi:subtilisin family serine protease
MTITGVVVAALFVLCSIAARAQHVPQSYIIRLKPGLSAKDVRALTSTLQARVSGSMSLRAIFSGTAGSGSLASAHRLDRYLVLDLSGASADVVAAAQRSGFVEEIFPNHRYHVDARFNDSLIGSQWALGAVEAEAAWNTTTGDSSVIVGIVDTGIQLDHPDLVGALAINRKEDINGNGRFDPWPSTEKREGISGDLDGIDQDGDGVADDVVGYDFVDQTVPNLGDWSGRDPIPADEFGHGTNVAGIIAATPDNRIGVAGLAPGVRILPVRAFDATGNGEDDDIAAAIVYAADRGARVINMSFGDLYYSPLMHDAIAYAYGKGVVLVASSGNDGAADIHFPSGYREVMAIGATDDHDRRTTFSSFGPELSMVAPGSGVITTGLDGGYEGFSGTSASAPHVSAAAALMVSLHPDWRPDEVRTTLELSADDRGTRGWDIYFGAGRLNLRRAVESSGAAAVSVVSPQIDEGYGHDTTVVVYGSATSVFLDSWQIFLGVGEDPEGWEPVGPAHADGRLLDTLGSFSTHGLPEGVITLRLRLTETNGRQTERRIRLHIDRTSPKIDPPASLSITNIWRYDERALAVNLRTDDLTRVTIFLRRADQAAGPFRELELEPEHSGLEHNHFLALTSGEMEGDVPYQMYLRLRNTAGDTALVGDSAHPLTATRERTAFPIATMAAKSYALPIGFSDGSTARLFGDGQECIAVNRYKNGSFDRLFLYSFDGRSFIPRDSTGTWVPRGFGDCDGNGRLEILAQLRGSSVVFEQAAPGASPFSSVKFIDSTSGNFYASGYADLDRDGKDEVIARSDPQPSADGAYFVSKWDGSTLRQVAQLPDPTPPAAEESTNQFGSSESAVGDFDGDGNPEILYGDNDADFVVYERQPDGSYSLRWSDVNDGEEGSRMVAAGDLDGDGRDEIIVGYHSRTLQNNDREYDAPLWTFKAVKLDSLGNARVIWSTRIAYVRPTDIFRTGVAVGDLDGVKGAELAISVFPNLYILRWDPVHQTMAPFWWHGGSISNRPIIKDFDGDGIAEVGTGDGEQINFYQIDPRYAGPQVPGGIHAWALSDSSAFVEWAAVSGVNLYRLYRGKHNPGDSLVGFSPILETSDLKALDTGADTDDGRLDGGSEYIYFVAAVDSSRGRPESDPSEFASVFTHNPARIVGAGTGDGRTIAVDFDVDISQALYRSGALDVRRASDGSAVELSSITSGGSRRLIAALGAERWDDTLTIRPTWLFRDIFGSPADTTSVARLVIPAREPFGERFIAARAYLAGHDTIGIDFNQPVDAVTGFDPANYTLDPPGSIVAVVPVQGREDRVYLIVPTDYPLGPLGRDYTITVRTVRSASGREVNDGAGSVVGFTLAAGELDQLFVYPHPFSLSKDGFVTFAGLTRSATVTIYTQSGALVDSVVAREGNGGAVWDGHDQRGRLVPTGIYFYDVSGIADDGRQIRSKLRKIAVVP